MSITDVGHEPESRMISTNVPPRAASQASARHARVAAAVAMALAAAAAAQESPESAQTQDDMGSLVITGSRLATSGFEAPTPVTTLSAEDLRATGTGTVIDRIVQLPMIQNSSLPQTVRVSTTGAAGASLLDLRGLAPTRTLVLLDGRRIVPVNSNGSPDASLIPQALLERVDVVTGGASAAYGSDAVSGVVNFILDKDFSGLKGSVQGGESVYEDAQNYNASVTGGMAFAGGRGHVLASLEYYDSDGVQGTLDRPFAQEHCALISVPTALRPPSNMIACDVRSALVTYGGLITAGPMRGIAFGPDGVPYQHDFGTLTTNNTTVGGNGVTPGDYINLMTALERKNAFLRVGFDLTERANIYLEGIYGHNNSAFNSSVPSQNSSRAFTIFRENAFLPQSIRDQMIAANITSFRMGRAGLDWTEGTKAQQRNKTYRLVGGVDGEISDAWKYTAYVEHGRNAREISAGNNQMFENVYRAADAVVDPVSGEIVCHSTLTDPDNGCVPMNLFGFGSPSQESIDYVLGTSLAYQTVKQDVFAVELSGEPFSTWAGPFGVAIGAEHRIDEMWITANELSRIIKTCENIRGCPADLIGFPGAFQVLNTQPTSGKVDVTEGYVEALVPLAKELPWAHSLNFNAAARYTEYSSSGAVTTWKAGLVYEPLESLRLRATRSRDIRAGNAFEMFTGFDESQLLINDPQLANLQYGIFSGEIGNPNVEPEEADSTTVGAVYQPGWLPGFVMSVDYYDIELQKAIGQYSAQQTVDGCFQGAQLLCGFINRDATTGRIITVFTPYVNRDALETSGFDIELAYTTELLGGNFTTRVLANNIQHKRTLLRGANPIELAGQLSGTGTPNWRGAMTLNYQRGPMTVSVHERFIGSGKLNLAFVEGVNITPADNDTGEVFYTDLSLRWGFEAGDTSYELFAASNNLFDRKPPRNTGITSTTINLLPTNYELYDAIGRTYSIGVRVDF
jgi:iron complex outermembrane receptor protein